MNIDSFRIHKDHKPIYTYFNLSTYGFLYRGKIKEIITAFYEITSSRESNLENNRLYQFDIDEIPDTILYLRIRGDKSYHLISNNLVNKSIVFHLFRLIDEDKTDIDELLNAFNKNPEKYRDKMAKINDQLDQTKARVTDSFDKLIARGEKLSDLMVKSDKLSEQSKIFLKDTKKLRKCPCVIM